MGDLTGKRKAQLRGLGQKLPETARIGKAGLTDAVVGHVAALLSRHGLVKVRLPEESPTEREARAARLAAATGSELVGLTGRMALLYRPGEGSAHGGRIVPPE